MDTRAGERWLPRARVPVARLVVGCTGVQGNNRMNARLAALAQGLEGGFGDVDLLEAEAELAHVPLDVVEQFVGSTAALEVLDVLEVATCLVQAVLAST